ncbi:MAG TPA: 6-carboxytetrahydropterin synthase [Phycisphaerales bacterium]|nr:6-carboxytetrahydropterin synthase [Phycisphaerales bacterium]
MFELSVEREFCAAHAIVINGRREPVHGHNWKVQVVVAGKTLDRNGLLCDFHVIERDIDAVIARFNNADLNATPPFDRINPTAERVAEHIGEEVRRKLPARVKMRRTTVSEAPGCKASFVPNDKS